MDLFASRHEVHSTNTYSAKCRLIKTNKTESFTATLEAESSSYRHFLTEHFATALEAEPQGYRRETALCYNCTAFHIWGFDYEL